MHRGHHHFRWTLHCLVSALIALNLVTLCQAQSVIAGQKRPGSVFISPELPEFALTVDGEAVQWSVTDFWNRTVASGTLPIAGNPTTLTFNPGALGYFAVHLVAVKNGALSAEVIAACAVLAPTNPLASAGPFGVAGHFAQGWNVDLMDLMTKAGIYRLRDENQWSQIEKTTRGNYIFPSTLTNFMAAAKTKGIEPLMALTFGNSLYDSGYAPYTDDSRLGYANYANKVLDQYNLPGIDPQIKEVEVWNEYNGSFAPLPPGYPSSKSSTYTAMLIKTFQTLRATHPNVKIGAGAAVLIPLPWFQELFQQGALNYLDALVVHPYRGIPEGVEKEIAALKALTRSFTITPENPEGIEKPIWVTECGTYSPDPARQSLARYLVRLMTLLRSEGVERISWYLLKDELSFASGLLYSDNSSLGKNAPSTGYPAFATLVRVLGDATIVGRETTDLRTRIYCFLKNQSQVRVAWSTSGSTRIIAQTGGALSVTDIMGNTRTEQPVNGYVYLTINEDPIYIAGNITFLQEIGRDHLLADSVAGYSDLTQGLNGWYYGFEVQSVPNPPFQLLTRMATAYGYRWQGSYYAQSLHIDNGHPSATYFNPAPVVPVQTIRRWVSNVAGPINIRGFSRRSAAGNDGTGIAVRVDGSTIYTRLVGPSRDDIANFSVRANVSVGSKVDFMINPGPGLDVDNDAIDYLLQISEPFAADDPEGDPTDDPDGDGLNNELENALGSDSRKADRAEYAPKMLLFTDAVTQEKYLRLQYRALQVPAGLTYQVVESDNLLDWKPAIGTTVNLQTGQDGTQLLEFREAEGIQDGEEHFLRLQVVTP